MGYFCANMSQVSRYCKEFNVGGRTSILFSLLRKYPFCNVLCIIKITILRKFLIIINLCIFHKKLKIVKKFIKSLESFLPLGALVIQRKEFIHKIINAAECRGISNFSSNSSCFIFGNKN